MANKKVKVTVRTHSGVGRPKFNMPKVKTRFNKKGYALRAMTAMKRRIGGR